MKRLASAIVAAAILIVGAGGLDQVWAGPPRGPVKARAWAGSAGGHGSRAWAGSAGGHGSRAWAARPGWYGPRGWWGGYGWRGYWGVRPWWGPAWYGYPAYPYAYYPYAYPPAVVQPNPQTYIEQTPPAPGPAQPTNYWYYCAGAKGYYPYVRECPEGWMTVVPPSSPPSP